MAMSANAAMASQREAYYLLLCPFACLTGNTVYGVSRARSFVPSKRSSNT
jgi:hypothetical protein